MRLRRIVMQFKRTVRGTKPLFWLVVVFLLCIWCLNFRSRNQHAVLNEERPVSQRSLMPNQIEVPLKSNLGAQVETNKDQPVWPTSQRPAGTTVENTEKTTPLEPIITEEVTSEKPIEKTNIHSEEAGTKSFHPNISFKCSPSVKRDHYIFLDFKPGRTGNALFQVFCLLSLSSKYCYTPVVRKRNRFFKKLLDPVFEIDNIERIWKLDTSTFHNLTNVLSGEVQDELSSVRHNWILHDRCVGHTYLTGQEQYIRSSVHFKDDIRNDVDEFMDTNFRDRPTVAVHVRRTDKMTNEAGYEYSDLEWYKPYILKAMDHLKANQSNLAFVFVSDDLQWCRDQFNDPDIFFSPCESVGCDLALVTSCDHVIITIGTYGWMGAWLGDHKTVIYNSKYVPKRFYKKDFFLPSWIGIE